MTCLQHIPQIDDMDGNTFEIFTVKLLKQLGYTNVHRTPGSHDYGVDVFATIRGNHVGFQCKHRKFGSIYRNHVGQRDFESALLGLYNKPISCIYLVTNGIPTSEVKRELQHSNQIILWGRHRLWSELKELNPRAKISLTKHARPVHKEAITSSSYKERLFIESKDYKDWSNLQNKNNNLLAFIDLYPECNLTHGFYTILNKLMRMSYKLKTPSLRISMSHIKNNFHCSKYTFNKIINEIVATSFNFGYVLPTHRKGNFTSNLVAITSKLYPSAPPYEDEEVPLPKEITIKLSYTAIWLYFYYNLSKPRYSYYWIRKFAPFNRINMNKDLRKELGY